MPATRATKPRITREAVKLDLTTLPRDPDALLAVAIEMQKIALAALDERDLMEASLFVLLEERPKYACPKCADGVLSAEPSPAPIARGLAGPGLLAHVAVSKYQDHLPLHRQEHIFERLGVDLSRSTMADWMGAVA